MGARQLRRLQLGRETTMGSLAAATVVWRGSGTIRDDTVVSFATEDVGVLGGIDRTFMPSQGASLALTPTEATFEQLPYIMEGGIKKLGTGVTDTGGSGKIYTYPMSSTAANTIQSFSIEGGDNSGAEVVKFGVVTDFTLNGQVFKPIMMQANLIAWESTAQAFTTSLTPIAVDAAIMFAPGKLCIDAIGTAAGTTQVSGSLKSMNIKVKTGVEPVGSVENLHYTTVAVEDPSLTGDLTFYWDSNAIAEKAKWLAQTGRTVQLRFDGAALNTAGSAYSKKALIMNMYGVKWTKFSEIQADGGHDVITASFENRYNTTATQAATWIIVNESSTLP